MSEAQKTNLIFTRVFDASIEEVWKAWTDSQSLMAWWGPIGFSCPLAKMDVRVGRTSLVGMSNPDFGDSYSTWDYQEILPMSLLDFIHNLADKDGNKVDPVAVGMPSDFPQDQHHTVSFKTLGDKQTELMVVEYGWTEGQMMEMSKLGMEQCLDKLAAHLASA